MKLLVVHGREKITEAKLSTFLEALARLAEATAKAFQDETSIIHPVSSNEGK